MLRASPRAWRRIWAASCANLSSRRTGSDSTSRDGTSTDLTMARFVFVTGGVVSSLGKGIAAASLGAILEARGLKVAMVKLDPYINVDPGTMSPFQHGEVFVTQ